ncbi:MAG: hypothetical protein K6F88_07910 [Ruminococcus sp.]|nr:hypothetical protein [Ruminococcus sp.]
MTLALFSRASGLIGTEYTPTGMDVCSPCSYGKDVCDFKYKNACNVYKALHPLGVKLYHDNSEIELFLSASYKNMMEYSTVKDYPEIFETIDVLCRDLKIKDISTGYDWNESKNKTAIITVQVRYEDLSYKNGCIISGDADAEKELERYRCFLKEDYYDSNFVPNTVWNNIWLIKYCLEIITDNEDYWPEICAGIKRNIDIPYDNIRIDEIS